jgi:hypothetical protein
METKYEAQADDHLKAKKKQALASGVLRDHLNCAVK